MSAVFQGGKASRKYVRICQNNMATGRSLRSLEAVSAVLTSSQPPAAMTEFTLKAVKAETGVEAAELFLLDAAGQQMVLAAHEGLFPHAFTQITRFSIGEGFPGLVAASCEPLYTDTLQEDRRYLRGQVKEKGFRYYLCLPLPRGLGILGCLNLASRDQPITSEARQFASIVSHQLSLALDRANLQVWRQLTMSTMTPPRLRREGHIDGLLQTVLHHLVDLAHAGGGVITATDGYGSRDGEAAYGECEERWLVGRSETSGGDIPPPASRIGRPGPHAVGAPSDLKGYGCAPDCPRTRIVLPLDSSWGRFGAVCLALSDAGGALQSGPAQTSEPWLRAAAEEAANAVYWANRLQHSQDLAVSRERQRLTQEVHDTLSQNLALIAQQAELSSRLSERDPEAMRRQLRDLRDTVRQSREDMHRVLRAVSPEGPQPSFVTALSEMVDRVQQLYALKIDLRVSGDREPPNQCRLLLYRLLQEALTNVVSHAEASQVLVELQLKPPLLSLSVRDNGQGFDPAILRDASRCGLGLRNMQERVKAFDGMFSVESAPGAGACLHMVVPYPDGGQTWTR